MSTKFADKKRLDDLKKSLIDLNKQLTEINKDRRSEFHRYIAEQEDAGIETVFSRLSSAISRLEKKDQYQKMI